MQYFRCLLFVTLGLDKYLEVIRKTYFLFFKAGLLKRNPVYSWHYFVQNLIKKGDVIIDIGANMGYYSYGFSKLTGNQGSVYSVEPVSPLVKQLRKQVKQQTNIVVLPMALGKENRKQVYLSVPEGFRKIGYLRHGLLAIQDPRDVQGRSGFFFEAVQRKASEVFSSLEAIDYIKCDVEGYEKIIFEDMEPLLIRHQPLVQVEIREDHFADIVGFFERLGYGAFKLDQQHLVALDSLSYLRQRSFDTLFVPARYYVRVHPFVDGMKARPMQHLHVS